MKTTSNKSGFLAAIGCLALLGLASTAQAAVIVYFEQDGSDVIMSWSGTLSTVTLTDTTLDGSDSRDQFNGFNLFHRANGAEGYYTQTVGTSVGTSLTSVLEVPSGQTIPSFGFGATSLTWNDVHISMGTVGAVTQLTFVPSRDVMRFSNVTLAGIRATSFSNTLAWVATDTNDTISFTTGAVPEPASLALAGLGSLALLARRRRRI